MTRTHGAILAAVLVVAAATPALANEDPGWTSDPHWGDNGGLVEAEVSGGGQVDLFGHLAGADGVPVVRVSFDEHGRATVTTTSARRWARVPVVRGIHSTTTTAHCHTLVWISTILTGSAYDNFLQLHADAFDRYIDLVTGGLPECDGDPDEVQVSDHVPEPDLQALIGHTVEQLPRPTPSFSPAYAILGLDTYLQTHRDLTFQPTGLTVSMGPTQRAATVTATGWFDVDWGQQDDGQGPAFARTTQGHQSPGRGYIDGTTPDDDPTAITHVYTSVPPGGTIQVTVTDYWRLDYTIDGLGAGSIIARLEPVTTTLEVREYQAVLRN